MMFQPVDVRQQHVPQSSGKIHTQVDSQGQRRTGAKKHQKNPNHSQKIGMDCLG